MAEFITGKTALIQSDENGEWFTLHSYLREISKDGKAITVCENLPLNYLSIENTTFNKANSRFKRALKSLNTIKAWRVNMMRFAVNFNLGWLWSEKELQTNGFYRRLI